MQQKLRAVPKKQQGWDRGGPAPSRAERGELRITQQMGIGPSLSEIRVNKVSVQWLLSQAEAHPRNEEAAQDWALGVTVSPPHSKKQFDHPSLMLRGRERDQPLPPPLYLPNSQGISTL